MSILLLVILIIVGLGLLVFLGLLAYTLIMYNKFISLRNTIENSFNQIRVALKKRLDMLSELMETVGSYAKFEKSTLAEVTKLRKMNISSVKDVRKVDASTRSLVGTIMAVMENYPNLKTMDAVKDLTSSIQSVEQEISRLRYLYNDEVQTFNVLVERIPTNLIAGLFGFKKKEYLQFEENVEKRPNIKF